MGDHLCHLWDIDTGNLNGRNYFGRLFCAPHAAASFDAVSLTNTSGGTVGI
jgi:hypothetical protein